MHLRRIVDGFLIEVLLLEPAGENHLSQMA